MTRPLCLYSIGIPPEAGLRWQMHTRYGWHQIVYEMFAGSNPSTLLWCAQKTSEYGGKCTVLTDGDITQTRNLTISVQKKIYPMEFLQAERYRFCVECSPRAREPGARTRSLSVPADRLEEWFVRRSLKWGFHVDQLTVEAVSTSRFTRRGQQLILPEVEFVGVLTVTDRDAFIRSATLGVGGRYGFGFGLLQLARLSA